jgi:hypothetical protein
MSSTSPGLGSIQAPIDWYNDGVMGTRESAAFSALLALRGLQSSRVYTGHLYDATYEQRNMFSQDIGSSGAFGGVGLSQWAARGEVNLLTYNAMQIGFDTLVSKLTQADATVKFMTDGADWINRKKAEQLEKLVRGEFYRLKFYEVKESIELDMLLHGRGYLKVYVDHDTKSPCLERIHPLDIFFDELEARDNPPQTMYQTKLVSKASLAAIYPEHAEAIMRSQLSGDSSVYSTRGMNPAQMCEVLECWRLPSSEGAEDGRHGMFVGTATLSYDPWTRCDFPFATMTWVKRRRGPYAIPAAEQIIFLQRNLNRLIQREHECIYMLSAPYLLMDENSNVSPSSFNTDVANIIQGDFQGRMEPKVVVNKVVPDDLRVAISQLKRDIADILGITGLESMGEKPQGLDSAPALEQYTEQSSLRHVKTLRENERFVLRTAEQLLETIRDIKDEYGDYAAFGQGRSEVEEVKFTDADLPANAYSMQMAPANMLPLTPAGRLNKITQLANTGAFTPKQLIRAFQSPDISAITDDITSMEEDIEWTIYEMCKPNGRYLPPDEHQDLQSGIEKVNDAYLRERRRNAPPEVLARLDAWVADALVKRQEQQAAELAAQQAQQQAMNAPPGMGPQAGAQNQPGLPPTIPPDVQAQQQGPEGQAPAQ